MMEKKCPQCNIRMIEARKAIAHDGRIMNSLYPKKELMAYKNRYYHEYRFYCKKCENEWLYFTRPDCKYFEKIPKNSQYRYSKSQGMLVLTPAGLKQIKKMFKN